MPDTGGHTPDETCGTTCSTCNGEGVIWIEGQIGVIGVGGLHSCPDCQPLPVRRLESS